MAYVSKTLAPGEEYVHRAKFNWTYDFTSVFWLLIGLAPAIMRGLEAGDLVGGEGERVFGVPFTVLASAAGATGFLILFTRYVHRWTTVIAITTTRLILKRGLISRISAEMALNKIEEVIVHQTFLGRMLGFGHITVRGTGISEIEFPDLADPIGLRRRIEEASIATRGP